jgi:hypothetical protein
MNQIDVHRENADRVFAMFRNIEEPMSVEEYGHTSIAVKEASFKDTFLTYFELQKLQQEFDIVHILQGKVK